MSFADQYARFFIVITFAGLESANSYLAKAEILGGIIPNLIAFGLFLAGIGYFLFTGPLFGKSKKLEK